MDTLILLVFDVFCRNTFHLLHVYAEILELYPSRRYMFSVMHSLTATCFLQKYDEQEKDLKYKEELLGIERGELSIPSKEMEIVYKTKLLHVNDKI